ncbi:MAG: T9SS type A sorting domain-containing protein [Bacteroidota bacterium]
MKKPLQLLVLLLCISAINSLRAQLIPIDTSGGRYWEPVFSSVTVTSNVTFGSATNINNSTQVLKMDIYEPAGDTVSMRPVLVLAHGGSFIGGTKTDQDVVELCNRFAKKGYVCASIDYRLGIGFPIDSVNATKAVVRAVQDMKAAVRFFRRDFAENGNSYNIHPNYIFCGGSSAGAFTGLHLAYLDQLSEVPSWINISSLGGLDGNSGNPGYSHRVNGVINLCGALGDFNWLVPGDVPFVSLHGDNDQTVPYGTAMIYVLGFPIMVVDGSSSLASRASSISVQNPLHTWYGQDHAPYYGTSAPAIAHMDTTESFVKAFLRPLLVVPSSTSVTETETASNLIVYPNPSQGDFYIEFEDAGQHSVKAMLIDLSGRTVWQGSFSGNTLHVQAANLPKGAYFLHLVSDKGIFYSRKIAIQ